MITRAHDAPRLIAILPRGEAIRNFVYSGALEETSRDLPVEVLSVLPSDAIREMLAARFGDVRELHEHRERWVVNVLREVLDMSHGRWLWSEAAQERWRLRDQEAVAFTPRLKRWAKKLACLPFANAPGLRLLSWAERGTSRALNTTDEYIELYRAMRPTLVFNGSHVHSRVATQAVQAAQWMGIKTATFIFSWDNLTSQGRIMLPYDHFIVWNEALRDQLMRIYPNIRPGQVHVTGTPQFDFHFREEHHESREGFCERVGADPARPIVLYSTGMANHMPGEHDIVEQIADMLADMPRRPQLLVRVYPKDRTNRFEPLRKRRADILFQKVPWEPTWLTPLEDDLSLYANTLRHSDLGINVASTVSLELCMFGKPVLNVGYNPPGVTELDYARYYRFDHYAPVVASGAVRVAGSPGELRAMIREELNEPGRHAAARAALVRRMFGDTLDGRCAERIAHILKTLSTREVPCAS